MFKTVYWNNNINDCPINKRIHFLLKYNNKLYTCIGTLTTNLYRGSIIRGECIEGDPIIFYEGDIIGWGDYLYGQK